MPVERTSIIKSGTHTVTTNLIQIAVSFLITTIVARSLGPTGKGFYDLFITTTTLLSTILGFSLTSGLVYVVASSRINVSKLIRYVTVFAAIQGVAAALLIFLILRTPFRTSVIPLSLGSAAIAYVALTVMFLSLSAMMRSVLVGQQRFIKANYGDLTKQFSGLVLILIGIVIASLAKIDPLKIIVITNLASISFATWAYRVSVSSDPHYHTSSNHGLQPALRFAAPSYVADMIQFLNYRLDVFFVVSILGARQLGLYQLAVFLSQLLRIIPNAAQSVLFPSVAASNEDRERNGSKVAQANRLLTPLSLICGFMLASLAPFGLPFIFGEPFRGSTSSLLWLIPGTVAFTTSTVVASYFAGIGRPKFNLIVSLAGVLMTIPLDLILIPKWGIIGASIASTVSYTFSSVVATVLFCYLTGMSIRDLFVLKRADWSLIEDVIQGILRFIRGWIGQLGNS